MPEQKPPLQQNDIMLEINNLGRQLRLMEERSANLRRKLQLVEQNMLSQSRRATADIRTALTEISEIRQEFSDFRDKTGEIMQSLEDTARKSDITQIERYLSIWKPVNFVTQNEIEEIVERAVRKVMKK